MTPAPCVRRERRADGRSGERRERSHGVRAGNTSNVEKHPVASRVVAAGCGAARRCAAVLGSVFHPGASHSRVPALPLHTRDTARPLRSGGCLWLAAYVTMWPGGADDLGWRSAQRRATLRENGLTKEPAYARGSADRELALRLDR